ncbi:MAG: hypothetical protein HGA90_03840, partial [Alphaproteobacteria bacterium]|nr:hypothetical protein [Alphaproteobacteria bacterium]
MALLTLARFRNPIYLAVLTSGAMPLLALAPHELNTRFAAALFLLFVGGWILSRIVAGQLQKRAHNDALFNANDTLASQNENFQASFEETRVKLHQA